MGDSNAVADTGTAQFLPGNQTVEDLIAIQTGDILRNKAANKFQYAFFTPPGHTQESALGGQNRLDQHN